jgi:hypothetical protein
MVLNGIFGGLRETGLAASIRGLPQADRFGDVESSESTDDRRRCAIPSSNESYRVDEKQPGARQDAPALCTDTWSDAGLKNGHVPPFPARPPTKHRPGINSPPFAARRSPSAAVDGEKTNALLGYRRTFGKSICS